MDSLRLRQLADKMDRLELAKRFDAPSRNVTPDLSVSWHYGASTVGYKELSSAIAKVVARRFDELQAEALADLECEVEDVRRTVLHD